MVFIIDNLCEMANNINITSTITCKETRIGNEYVNFREEENNDINTHNNENLINNISTIRQLN